MVNMPVIDLSSITDPCSAAASSWELLSVALLSAFSETSAILAGI